MKASSSGERILREINDFYKILRRPLDEDLTEREGAENVYVLRNRFRENFFKKRISREIFSDADFNLEYNRCARLSIRLFNVPGTADVTATEIKSMLMRLLATTSHLKIDRLRLSCFKNNSSGHALASITVLVPGDDDASVAILEHIVANILNRGLLRFHGGPPVQASSWPFTPSASCVEEACMVQMELARVASRTAGKALDYHSRKMTKTIEEQHEKEMEFKKFMAKALPPVLSPPHDVARTRREVAAKVNPPVTPDHPHFALHAAVKANDIAAVQSLIALLGQDLNLSDDDGRTALHWAAFLGFVEVAEILISDLRMNVDIADQDGRTALHLAALRNHVPIMEMLLPEPSQTAEEEQPPQRGLLRNRVKEARERDRQRQTAAALARADTTTDEAARTALHAASYQGRADVVLHLLPIWANVNAQDNHGLTPLHMASANGHHEASSALLTAPGIDINIRDQESRTALHFAASRGHHQLTQLLLAQVNLQPNISTLDGRSPLHFAALNGHLLVVQMLAADHRVDINLRDQSGRTALHYASEIGHADVVYHLLTIANLDSNIQDGRERTALHYASHMGHLQTALALLSRPETNTLLREEAGRTAMEMAAVNGYAAIVSAFLDRLSLQELKVISREVNLQDQAGVAVLHLASGSGQKEVVRLLLDNPYINIALCDNRGNTALHWASELGHTALVEIFYGRIDVNTMTNRGSTALHLAVTNGHVGTVAALLTNPTINLNMQNAIGNTALHLAALVGNAELFAMLAMDARMDSTLRNQRGQAARNLMKSNT